jgi:hypothetical protein
MPQIVFYYLLIAGYAISITHSILELSTNINSSIIPITNIQLSLKSIPINPG